MSHSAARTRAGWISLVAGTGILAGKLAAAAVTGSVAVLSDAMESVVNVTAAALLVYTLTVAARPADRDHPYGHGKVEFFSAGIEGALIAVAGLLILVQSVREIWVGPELHRLDLGLVLVAAAAAANGLLGRYLIELGRRTRSVALEADGRHLLTDVLTSGAVLAGLGAVRITGWAILDPLIALALAVHILATGWRLVRRAVGGLMDEADLACLGWIVEAMEADREPWCIDVHGLRHRSSGGIHHVDLHVVVPRYYDVEKIHEMNDRIEAQVRGAVGEYGDVLVHFDPCRPRQCPGCAVDLCPVRGAPMADREALSLAGATRVDEILETGAPVAPTAP